ncbi:hypothetical protein HanXRQr2_Chr05g0226871 [Helianthus annuus]|uniref:Uncharacterized protein n=1 Tax=Helianthus annuus TaxID=4232 RepID=A0A9K3J124_HELAN|nr:hypothetical protein HanXRQr2_Chr05g0226871 [Helianthus annuus]KAJ0923678.1 hypothetical protein HanPSC8_Chr05g0218871 [Helianthus annuus]
MAVKGCELFLNLLHLWVRGLLLAEQDLGLGDEQFDVTPSRFA